MQQLQNKNAEVPQAHHIVVPASEGMQSHVEYPQLDTPHQIGATAVSLSRAEDTPQEVWGGLHHDDVSLEVGAASASASDADQGVPEMDKLRVGYMSDGHVRSSYRLSGPLIIGKTIKK